MLYCDTDSVIYVQRVDELPKVTTGDYLGDLTDELEEFGSGSYIDEFVLGGPKNLCVLCVLPSTRKHATKCKVKGVTLNYENSKFVNLVHSGTWFRKTTHHCMYTTSE